jgi:Na+/phosphate symporter
LDFLDLLKLIIDSGTDSINTSMNMGVIIEILLAAILGLMGFFLRELYNKLKDAHTRIDEMAKEITNINVNLPSNYITKAEFNRSIDILYQKLDEMDEHMEKRFDRLFEKLDTKADK